MIQLSIVIVNLNNLRGLTTTINSIITNNCQYVQILIIDGGSTDGSVEYIKKNYDNIFYWVSEPDAGIYDAMNKGIAASTGDYIYFLNTGDALVFELKQLQKILEKNIYNDLDALVFDVFICDSNIYKQPVDFLLKNLHHQGIIYKNNDIQFEIKYKVRADHVFNLKHLKRIRYFNEILANVEKAGFSSRNIDYDFYLDVVKNKLHIEKIRNKSFVYQTLRKLFIQPKSGNCLFRFKLLYFGLKHETINAKDFVLLTIYNLNLYKIK